MHSQEKHHFGNNILLDQDAPFVHIQIPQE